jgi:hypothetical protein
MEVEKLGLELISFAPTSLGEGYILVGDLSIHRGVRAHSRIFSTLSEIKAFVDLANNKRQEGVRYD